MNVDQLFTALGTGTILAPVVLFGLMGVTMLINWPLSERTTARWTQATVVVGLASALAVLALMLVTDRRNISLNAGNFVVIDAEHFHFHLDFMFDRLSVPFAILSFVLVGTIGAFANHYLHREPGFRRFFLLYAMFLVGMIVASLAGTIETLFFGWELVGLSSALLVAFFQERPSPVLNGQRVWSVYRIADAAFLIAAVVLHHLHGEGDFDGMVGAGAWPDADCALSSTDALIVGLLLLVAAAGKSALIPFSGWLPRAMEGPTPSSAVFYGALSVHLGCFLLLRVSPLLTASIWLSAAVVLLGLSSAVFAAMAARVQTDVKSALAFASLVQVGLITAEIGFGLRYIPLIHIIGHACMRTLQLVRAPTLLQDYRTLENAIGARLPNHQSFLDGWLSEAWRVKLYRLSLERGYLDAAMDRFIVHPFVRVFHWFDAIEGKWTDTLSGTQSRESDQSPTATPPFEELL